MKDRLRADLRVAMKTRDRTASVALRSALAAIDNAEAVEVGDAVEDHLGSEHVAGAVPGMGAADRQRRDMSDEEVTAILRDELRQHLDAAARAAAAGRPDLADEFTGQARTLSRYVADQT